MAVPSLVWCSLLVLAAVFVDNLHSFNQQEENLAYHESRSKMVGRGPRGGRHTFNTARGTLKRPFCTLSGRLRISVPRKGTIQLTIGSLTGGGGNLQSRIRASVGHSHTEGQPLLCHTVPNMTCLPFVEGFKGCLITRHAWASSLTCGIS